MKKIMIMYALETPCPGVSKAFIMIDSNTGGGNKEITGYI